MTRTLHPLALLIPFSLVAQTAPAPQAPSPQTDGGTVNLTLQDAIQTALKNNLQVSIAEQTRNLAKGQLMTAEGAYDWNLTGSANNSKSQRASFPGEPTSTTFQRSLTLGVNKPFTWGGDFSVQYAPAYYLSESLQGYTTVPYNGAISATYTQNLLSGFGTT